MLVIIVIIVLLWVWWKWPAAEPFATRKEKARSIFDWFRSNPSPTYTEYKKEFPRVSNIVEYEDGLRLFQSNQFTPDEIEKII